jgi:hypothetical protein
VNVFDFVIVMVILSMAKGTVHKYLDYRMRIADRQVSSGDRNLMHAIEEVRAEVAALKRHETDAILSFDSTLQTLDARVKHLERYALGDGAGDRTSQVAVEARRPQAAPAPVSGATPVTMGQASRSE